MADLRDFRKRVAVLKKQGLISGKTRVGKKVDARSAYPSWKVNGKTLGSIVKKYDDVASGKATAVKVPPKKLKQFKKAGYETTPDAVIVPHSAGEKAKLEQGEVVIKSRSGIERVQIPVPFQNLHKYLTDIQKNKARINRMKARNEYFGFRFFGNNSSALYSDIGNAIEDLLRYSAVVAANTRVKQQEIYRNLEIVRVNRSAAWVFPSEKRRTMNARYNRLRAKAFRKRLKSKPGAKQVEYLQAAAERQKRYRARIKKGNGNRYRKFKKQARQRAAKSRNRKPKRKK